MINRKENIEWIDGAKGVAIISVILLHSLPCLYEIGSIFHIGQAVPYDMQHLFVPRVLMCMNYNCIMRQVQY
mgnify:CR=1 FL=1